MLYPRSDVGGGSASLIVSEIESSDLSRLTCYRRKFQEPGNH